jgi:Ni,Fe-hydrogenase maturation factor
VRGAERVVFVDSTAGFAREPGHGEVVLLSAEEVAAESTGRFDHAAGLPYLLRALPAILEAAPPPITVVGVEGEPGPELVERAARAALGLVAGASTCGGLP